VEDIALQIFWGAISFGCPLLLAMLAAFGP
jgi:hypothetical protein